MSSPYPDHAPAGAKPLDEATFTVSDFGALVYRRRGHVSPPLAHMRPVKPAAPAP